MRLEGWAGMNVSRWWFRAWSQPSKGIEADQNRVGAELGRERSRVEDAGWPGRIVHQLPPQAAHEVSV